MLVSLIYTACNQGDWVRTTLPLAVESLGDTPHEIIVVDDQSVDGCCHGLGRNCLVVRTEQRVGVSAARRIGAGKAQGDVLLWSDPHCEYPGGALTRLAELARINRAIVQPPTKNRPQSSRVAWGGRLENCVRGIAVRTSRDRAQAWPALINTIYAMRRELYDAMGGWPELPGCWGGSEQALTLMAWSCRIPVVVADTEPCIHYAYQHNRRMPYFTSKSERAINCHYVHAAFFPLTYASYWRARLEQHFGYADQCAAALKDGKFGQLCRQIKKHGGIAGENELLAHVDGMDVQQPIHRDEALIAQQRDRALVKKHAPPAPRLRKTLEWFESRIPGCFRGKSVLDVGARDGDGCVILQQMKTRHVEGIELVPDVVADARRRGRPVREGDMRRLADPDDRWHLVTCVHALEHVPNPKVALGELTRVLRPGGWLLIVVPREDRARKEWAHNSAFPDSAALKRLVGENQHLDPQSIKCKVTTYTRGKLEIRLAVRKKERVAKR